MTDSKDLRKRAEEQLARIAEMPESLSPEEIRRVLHELRVHQIELEMQNEELRRAQVEIETARARYFDLYDLAPVGYCTVSEKGLILEANLTAATLLGVARAELVKKSITRFILKEDQDIYYLHRKQLFETGEPQACELRMLKQNAAPFWALLEAAAARDDGGAGVCRIVLSDITALKQLEEERVKREAQNRLIQKAESLGRMAGAVAHHFNNHLQAVIGNIELAMGDRPRSEAPDANLSEAMQAARRAAEVSGLMLTYLGQSTGEKELLDLCELCGRILPLIQAAMPKAIALRTSFPSPGPAVAVNANQILQVVTNLSTNAYQAIGDQQGTIRLAVTTVSPAEIPAAPRFPINWRPGDNSYACLEVVDTGCGITDQEIEKIFDPFFSSKFTGRGMGLAVVLGIVQAHGGAVSVQSEPGRGCIFRVFLPLAAKPLLHRTDPAAQAPRIEAGGTALLVEDEEQVRNVASIMLARQGFTVLEAKDGAEAVELFQKHQGQIRFVLCDLTMPRMDGWQTLAALRQIAPGVPVILCSGYGEAQVMEGAHLERPQAYLRKPYRSEELREAIGKALGK